MLVDKANVCGAQKVWLKLPEKWVNEEAKERAVKFFTGMHFRFEAYDETPIAQAIQSVQDVQSAEAVRSAQTVRPAQAVGDDFANEGRWMVADIDDFHACCHH